jgi:hypothetical protein
MSWWEVVANPEPEVRSNKGVQNAFIFTPFSSYLTLYGIKRRSSSICFNKNNNNNNNRYCKNKFVISKREKFKNLTRFFVRLTSDGPWEGGKGGGQGRPSIVVWSFSAILLLQNGIFNKSWITFLSTLHSLTLQMRGYWRIKSLKITFLHITTAVLLNIRIQIKFTLILLQRYPGRELKSYTTFVEKEKYLPSNSSLETTEVFQYDIHVLEQIPQKWRYTLPGRAALVPLGHGPTVRKATRLEFLVPTFNTKKIFQFPLI